MVDRGRLVSASDGALWFTENSGNKIGRITTAGVITEYSIPTNSSRPQGITAGPDGALWFTENSGNKIGRMTTSGAITEYPSPRRSRALGHRGRPDGVALVHRQQRTPHRPDHDLGVVHASS